jgi:hypothetical protein
MTNEEMCDEYKKFFYESGYRLKIAHKRYRTETAHTKMYREQMLRHAKLRRISAKKRKAYNNLAVPAGSEIPRVPLKHWFEFWK